MKRKAKQERQVDHTLTESKQKQSQVDLEECSACHKPLSLIPVNSRVKAVACVNRRCNLYRTRIRYA